MCTAGNGSLCTLARQVTTSSFAALQRAAASPNSPKARAIVRLRQQRPNGSQLVGAAASLTQPPVVSPKTATAGTQRSSRAAATTATKPSHRTVIVRRQPTTADAAHETPRKAGASARPSPSPASPEPRRVMVSSRMKQPAAAAVPPPSKDHKALQPVTQSHDMGC